MLKLISILIVSNITIGDEDTVDTLCEYGTAEYVDIL